MSLQIGVLESSRAGGVPFLLDNFPAASNAYSFRKLRSSYVGSCIRVRRASDNTESNIGFVNNVLDTTSLINFCNGTIGYITIWYDQSGNSMNFTQTNTPRQPRIINNGVIDTINSKPAIRLDGVDDSIAQGTNAFTATNFSIFQVFKINDNVFMTNDLGNGYLLFGFTSSFGAYSNTVLSSYKNNTLLLTPNSLDVTANYGNNQYILSSGFYGSANNLGFGFSESNSYPVNGYLQELIVYKSNQSTNNTAINDNINSFYTIY